MSSSTRRSPEPPEFLRQFIQTGLFVGHFRYLAPLVEDQLGVQEDTFWTMLREEVLTYQKHFPELSDRFELSTCSPRRSTGCA